MVFVKTPVFKSEMQARRVLTTGAALQLDVCPPGRRARSIRAEAGNTRRSWVPLFGAYKRVGASYVRRIN